MDEMKELFDRSLNYGREYNTTSNRGQGRDA